MPVNEGCCRRLLEQEPQWFASHTGAPSLPGSFPALPGGIAAKRGCPGSFEWHDSFCFAMRASRACQSSCQSPKPNLARASRIGKTCACSTPPFLLLLAVQYLLRTQYRLVYTHSLHGPPSLEQSETPTCSISIALLSSRGACSLFEEQKAGFTRRIEATYVFEAYFDSLFSSPLPGSQVQLKEYTIQRPVWFQPTRRRRSQLFLFFFFYTYI
jgi:hypothetical protein